MATSANDALAEKLYTDPTQLERIDDIKDDSMFAFDFLNATKAEGQGGFLVAANVHNYPALLAGNTAMTVGYLAACGLNSPHTHPRATEIQIITYGGPVKTGFIMENGARQVTNILPLGSATVFPKGSLHYQQNLACSPTIFVSAFDNYDPGVLQVAQSFFDLDPGHGVINATLGDMGVNILSHLNLPANVVLGAQECLDRCHIDRSTFNFSSTFADYIASTNSSWTMPSALPSSVTAGYGSHSTSGSNNFAAALGSDGSGSIPFSQNPLHTTVIGLGAASAALLLACLAMLCTLVARRRRHTSTGIDSAFRVSGGRGFPYVTPYDDADALNPRQSTDKP